MVDKAIEEAAQGELDLTTPPEGFTEEDWADLSDAEKEGILDKSVLEGEEEKEEEEKEEEKEEEEVTDEALEKIAGEEKPGETPAPEEKPAGEAAAVEELLSFRPVVTDDELKDIVIPEVPKISEIPIPKEIQDALDALEDEFDTGDIERKEYNQKRDALRDQATDARQEAREAAIQAHNDALQARENSRADLAWLKEQAAFYKAYPEYADKTTKGNMLYGALGAVLQGVITDPAFVNATGVQQLVEADKRVKAEFSIVAAPKKEEPAAKGKKPPAPLPDIKTLGDAPNAAPNDTDDPYAAIDKLTGPAYEAALEKLTPEQRKAFEDGATPRTARRRR